MKTKKSERKKMSTFVDNRFKLSPAKKELLGHIELLCSNISEKGMEKLVFCARDISVVEAWNRGELQRVVKEG